MSNIDNYILDLVAVTMGKLCCEYEGSKEEAAKLWEKEADKAISNYLKLNGNFNGSPINFATNVVEYWQEIAINKNSHFPLTSN